MAFLNPLFFLGGLAVAVPVLLHLIRRENARKMEFPSLMFLRRIQKRTIRYQKLRHLLLLLLRILAFLFVVLAFTRPYRTGSPAAASIIGGTSSAHIIAVDNSMSMSYQGRWAQAERAAADIVRQSSPGDKFALLEFSDKTVVQTPLTTDSSIVLRQIGNSKGPGDRQTRYTQALRTAEKIAQEAGTGKRVIHLISDFQKNGLTADETGFQLRAGIELKYVDLGSREFSNLTIQNVHVIEAGRRDVPGLSIGASITAYGARDYKNVPVNLIVDDRKVSDQRIDVAKASAEPIEFNVPNLDPGMHLAMLEIEDAYLTRDNRFYLTIEVREKTPVLSVEKQDRRSGRSPSFFLARALNVDALSPYSLTTASPQNFSVSGKLLIWNDAPGGGRGVQNKLEDFVKGGGGLIIVLGDSTRPSDFNGSFGSWLPVKLAQTPSSAGRSRNRPEEEFVLMTDIRTDHPIFEPFGKPHSGTFSNARFYSHSKVSVDSGAEVLARFDNGIAALVSMKVGEGRVLLYTSSADISSNDLPLTAVYAPFWHQVLRYLENFEEERHWWNVGDVLDPERVLSKSDLPGSGDEDSDEVVAVLDPAKQRLDAIPGSKSVVTETAGFYEIRTMNSKAAVAVNPWPFESDLAHRDAEEMTAEWISSQPAAFSRDEPPAAEELDRRQRIWGFLLLAAVLFLISESLLSNGGWRGTQDGKANVTALNS
jgi:hypothetical protein